MNAWIGLGSNQDGPETQLCEGLHHLQRVEGIEVIRISGFYRTAPWGEVDQDPYINAVAEIMTTLPPVSLLQTLLKTEQLMGRQRTGQRWGPRCIDMDLLTYNEFEFSSPELELPHPRMHLRAFVLRPLLELDEGFQIPGIGPARLALEALGEQGVQWLGAAEEFCNRNKHT